MVRKSKNVSYQTISEEEAEQVLFNSNGMPIVISFTAEWTANGLILDDFYEKLAQDYHNTIYFFRIDIDESPEYADKFRIHSVPTTLIFREKEIIDRFEGVLPKKKIEQKLDKIIKKR